MYKRQAPPAREDREIESWLGDLRGSRASGTAAANPPQPLRPSAEPTRAMPDTGAAGNEPTTAIPAQRESERHRESARHDDSDDSAASTRAIPTARQSDADAATEKLNTRPDDEATRRGGKGLSAQDLLRREGRL
ncbi:hypothetical protein [Mycolicibacterium austroafricanum]|uniref:hypothetical protein n=1 Tax=Mycolicibacterium austroafricanum TaxID=39687 RepID=UPI0022AA65FA|nr:hypothetical protein [Mycolicibacterium austroafricanum]